MLRMWNLCAKFANAKGRQRFCHSNDIFKKKRNACLCSENVGNFHQMQKAAGRFRAYRVGRECCICIFGYSYDHHYGAASPAHVFLLNTNHKY